VKNVKMHVVMIKNVILGKKCQEEDVISVNYIYILYYHANNSIKAFKTIQSTIGVFEAHTSQGHFRGFGLNPLIK
jgi:hypothetical protein